MKARCPTGFSDTTKRSLLLLHHSLKNLTKSPIASGSGFAFLVWRILMSSRIWGSLWATSAPSSCERKNRCHGRVSECKLVCTWRYVSSFEIWQDLFVQYQWHLESSTMSPIRTSFCKRKLVWGPENSLTPAPAFHRSKKIPKYFFTTLAPTSSTIKWILFAGTYPFALMLAQPNSGYQYRCKAENFSHSYSRNPCAFIRADKIFLLQLMRTQNAFDFV